MPQQLIEDLFVWYWRSNPGFCGHHANNLALLYVLVFGVLSEGLAMYCRLAVNLRSSSIGFPSAGVAGG